MACSAALASLVACGGGGGGDSSTLQSTTKPSQVTTIVQDRLPTGGIANSIQLPMNLAARWENAILNESDMETGDVETQLVNGATATTATLQSTSTASTDVDTTQYTLSANGLSLPVSLFEEFDSQTTRVRGVTLVYPTTRFPVGTSRVSIRQGDLGEDLDDDGTNDAFRIEFTQTLVGEVSRGFLYTHGAPVTALHFITVIKHEILLSDKDAPVVWRQVTADEYVVSGVGPVKSTRSYSGSNPSPLPERTELKSALIDGVQMGSKLLQSSQTRLPVQANMSPNLLTYMPFLNVIVAYDPTSATLKVIDPHNGALLGSSGPFQNFSPPTSSGSDLLYAIDRNELVRL
jgi:hypothetical protein